MPRRPPPPIEAFGRKPAVIDVDINPAGTRLAWLEENGKTTRLIMHRPGHGKDLRTVTALTGVKGLATSTGQTMKPCSSQVSATQTSMPANGQAEVRNAALVCDRRGRRQRSRDADAPKATGSRAGARTAACAHRDSRKDYMSTLDFSPTNYRTGNRHAGWRAGARTPAGSTTPTKSTSRTASAKLIAAARRSRVEWLVDHSGTTIVRSDFNPQSCEQSILRRRTVSAGASCIAAKRMRRARPRGFSADGAAVVALGSTCDDGQQQAFWSIPLDGTPMKSCSTIRRWRSKAPCATPRRQAARRVARRRSNKPSAGSTPMPSGAPRRCIKSFSARWITLRQPVRGQPEGRRARRRRNASAHLLPGRLRRQEGRHRR